VDPLTTSPLPPPSQAPRWALASGVATASGASAAALDQKAAAAAAAAAATASTEPTMTEVTPDTLLPFLEHIVWSWLGEGVSLQVSAFREGLGDIIELNGPGVGLAFDAREQRDLFCGPDTVEWSEQSLRKTLRPTGGLKEDENTMVWLRQELVNMPQPKRLDFMELTTGMRFLAPDKVMIMEICAQLLLLFLQPVCMPLL